MPEAAVCRDGDPHVAVWNSPTGASESETTRPCFFAVKVPGEIRRYLTRWGVHLGNVGS